MAFFRCRAPATHRIGGGGRGAVLNAMHASRESPHWRDGRVKGGDFCEIGLCAEGRCGTPTTHSTTTPTTADSVAEPPTTGSSALPPALPPPVGTLLARCRRHSCRRAASWPPQQPRGAELEYIVTAAAIAAALRAAACIILSFKLLIQSMRAQTPEEAFTPRSGRQWYEIMGDCGM